MLIEHYQFNKITLDFLKFKHNLDSGPKSINDIREILENYGVKIRTFQSEVKDLIQSLSSGPIIALVDNKEKERHFILIYKISKDKLLVADPNNIKLEWISLNQFSKSYLGIFSTTKKSSKFKISKINLLDNFKIIKDNLFFVLTITFFGLVCDTLIILSNTFLKNFLAIVETNLKSDILVFFFGFGLIFLIFLILSYLQAILIKAIYKKVCIKQKLEITNNFLAVDFEKFKNMSPSRWYQIFVDIHAKNEIVVIKFFKYFNNFIIASICMVLLAKINIYFFSFVVIENLIILFIGRIFYGSKKDLNYKIKNSENTYQNNLREIVDGFLVTKTRHEKKEIIDKLMNNYQINLNNNSKMAFLSGNIDSLEYLIHNFFYLLVFYFATFMINDNTLKANELIYFSVLALQIKKFFTSINFFLDDVLKLKIINENISFMNITSKSNKKTKFLENEITEIKVQNYSKFWNSKPILNDYEEIFSGHNFIKGKNGSGKSTLMLSMAGVIMDFFGEITYNGFSHRKIDSNNKILYLSNDDYIMETTIEQYFKKNWKVNPDHAKYYEIVFQIINDLGINLYKVLKNNASNLSVGQKQIINFAAILFSDFDVYLIDESLSNVSFDIKIRLIEIMLEVHKNKLIIFCDHDSKIESRFKFVKVVE